MDGYNLTAKYMNIKNAVDMQLKLNSEISQLSKDLDNIEIPDDMDEWMNSLAEIGGFTLSEYKKLFKYNREYNKLIDLREENTQKLKVITIDNLLEKINALLVEKT